MKKYICYIIFTVLIFVQFSCSDFLNENPITTLNQNYLYNTPDGLNSAVNALYNLQRLNNFPPGQGAGFSGNIFFYVGTDLGLRRTWWGYYTPEVMQPNSGLGLKTWNIPYKVIDRANAIIKNARHVNMDKEKKNKLVAQAKAIRAENYFTLLREFDNIVLDTTVTKSPKAVKKEYKVADPNDVYNLIDTDLDFAIRHLSANVDPGRYSKGLARFIRAQSAMWQKKWSEAADQIDSIVNSGVYRLMEKPSEVFKDDRNNKESLYTYQFSKNSGGGENRPGGYKTNFNGVFQAREYEIGPEIIPDTSNGGYSFGWYYPNDYLYSLYDKSNDRRFTAYYYQKKLKINNPASPDYSEYLPRSKYPDDFRKYHWSLKKFADYSKPVKSYGGYTNMMYYRYAEVLLVGAEAHWRESNKNNHDPIALKYINKIRERAFGDNNHNFTEFTLNDYLKESARELALENKHRWFLLKRLGILVDRVNQHYQVGSNSGNLTIPAMMKPYMTRLPIPQREIDLMETFPQNTGY